MELIQPTHVMLFEDMERAIEEIVPTACKQENSLLMALDLKPKFQQLDVAGKLDPKLFLKVLSNFHSANGPEEFKIPVLQKKIELNKALGEVSHKTLAAQKTHLIGKQLWCTNLLEFVRAECQAVVGSKQWSPANNPIDSKQAPASHALPVGTAPPPGSLHQIPAGCTLTPHPGLSRQRPSSAIWQPQVLQLWW